MNEFVIFYCLSSRALYLQNDPSLTIHTHTHIALVLRRDARSGPALLAQLVGDPVDALRVDTKVTVANARRGADADLSALDRELEIVDKGLVVVEEFRKVA